MTYLFDDFEFDAERLELRRAGQPLKVDAVVLRLLGPLVRQAGSLISKEELVDSVWEGRAVADNVISVAMVRLRKALGHRAGEREFVVNVHGRGYRFVRPVQERTGLVLSLPTDPRTLASSAPFVGRAGVLGRLRDMLAEAQAGRGAVCVLRGEPGVGKTRTLEELSREAQAAGWTVAWGYCQEALDTPPLWPFVHLLRELLTQCDLAREAGAPLGQLSILKRLLPELREPDQALLRELGSTDARADSARDGAQKYQLFDSVMEVLTRAAAQRPCLLILDDLHRADTASLELLRCWIDRSARTRILVALTTQRAASLGGEREALLTQILGHRNCVREELGRLDGAAVKAYVATVLEGDTSQLARAVFEKSEGNPFFMVELVRVLRHSDGLAPNNVSLSHGALEIVRRRVHALDTAAHGVLTTAAVIGRTFDLALLGFVLQEEPSALMARLDAAVRAEVLCAARDSRTSFTFAHDLLRAALYEELTPSARRACHARVALVLEQREAELEAAPPAVLAFHTYAALPDADLRKTVTYCSKAADAALELGAYADAQRYLSHAREALELSEKPSARLRLALLLRQALCARICSSRDFEPLIRKLIRVAREQKAATVLAQAVLLLAPNPGFAALPGTTVEIENALTLLSPADEPLRGALLARLCNLGPLAYDAERAEAQVTAALALGRRSALLLTHYTACAARAYLLAGPMHPERSVAAERELEQLCQAHPKTLTVPPVLIEISRAFRGLTHGDLDALTAALERAEALSRELGDEELLWYTQRFRIISRLNEGAGKEELKALAALHKRAADAAIVGSALLAAFDGTVVAGDRAGMEDRFRGVLDANSDDPPCIWALKVRVLAFVQRRHEAEAALTRLAPRELGRLPGDRDYLGTLAALARAAIDLHARDYAEALEPLLIPHVGQFAANVALWCEGPVTQLLGELLTLRGARAQAVRWFSAAISDSERAGLQRCAAQARLSRVLCRDA